MENPFEDPFHARKKVVGFLLPLGLCLALLADSSAKEKKKGGPMLGKADYIWNTMVSTNFLKTEKIAECRADKECLGILAEKWRRAGKAEKVQAMPNSWISVGNGTLPKEMFLTASGHTLSRKAW